MTPATPHNHSSLPNEVEDRTLALLAGVQARDGLEQRVLARLASTPVALPWYRQLAPTHWMLATASALVVASAVMLGVSHTHPAAPTAPAYATHAPHAVRQPVSAAAGVAVPDHRLQHSPDSSMIKARHRSAHRAFRAEHERSTLPPGTVAPTHPRALTGQH